MSSSKQLFAIVAVLAVLLCSAAAAQPKVKATAILFRHGQRTTTQLFPTLNNEMTKDLGFGQLTNTGSQQLYENGILLRIKYHHLLPKNGFFRLSNMQILSSVPERTMLSLQSFMAGFLPPPLLDTTLPLYWQPFYHSVDNAGRVLYMDKSACARLTASLRDMFYNPPAYLKNWVVEDRAILDKLSQELETPLNSAMEVLLFSEALKSHIFLDTTIPQWVLDAFDSTLKKYVVGLFDIMHDSIDEVRLRGSPMLKQMVENMEAIENNEESGKNFLIYSGHDMNLVSLSMILGVRDQIPTLPNYSDTFMVDLLDNGTVQVIFMNTGGNVPVATVLDVPGCGKGCPLSTFKAAVKDMIVDWDALCVV